MDKDELKSRAHAIKNYFFKEDYLTLQQFSSSKKIYLYFNFISDLIITAMLF